MRRTEGSTSSTSLFVLTRCHLPQVFAMSGGYTEFAQRYPFMCCGEQISVQHDQAQVWPAEIIPGRLYLSAVADVNATVRTAIGVEPGHVIYVGPKDADIGVQHIHLKAEQTQESYMPLLEGLEAFTQMSGAILLCCEDGISQSATVAVAAVMMQNQVTHMQALAYVMKRKRNVAPMNNNFQFQELEKQLASSSLPAAPAEK